VQFVQPARRRQFGRRPRPKASGQARSSACRRAGRPKAEPQEWPRATADLVSKSLIVANTVGPKTRYVLLETTRASAHAKLAASGELDKVSRQHAEYYIGLLERGANGMSQLTAVDWRARSEPEVGNVRSALEWSFSGGGDPDTAVELTVVAAAFLTHMSPLGEGRARTNQALALLTERHFGDELHEMKLNAALGSNALHLSVGGEEMSRSWGRVREVAAGSADEPVGDRLVGVTLYFLGELSRALRHLDGALGRTADRTRGSR